MLLGFKQQFGPMVRMGFCLTWEEKNAQPDTAWRTELNRFRADGLQPKRTTIRGRAAKPGETLYLYTGLRTKNCVKLGEAVCKRCRPITIHEDGIKLGDMDLSTYGDSGLLLSIANDDGFATFSLMRTWFRETHGLPFSGHLIEW